MNADKQYRQDISTNDEELKNALNEIDKALSDETTPFFDRFRKTSDVLRAVDAGEVPKRRALAEAPSWNLYYLAVLRFQAGQTSDTASRLRELVENAEN